MEKKKQIIEDALISGKSIDELIKIKMKEEMKSAFEKIITKQEHKRIYDITQIPKGILFSKKTIFKKFNKANQTISYINGVQAEAMLGMDESSREKLLRGEIEVFATDNAFIKFEYSEIIDHN